MRQNLQLGKLVAWDPCPRYSARTEWQLPLEHRWVWAVQRQVNPRGRQEGDRLGRPGGHLLHPTPRRSRGMTCASSVGDCVATVETGPPCHPFRAGSNPDRDIVRISVRQPQARVPLNPASGHINWSLTCHSPDKDEYRYASWQRQSSRPVRAKPKKRQVAQLLAPPQQGWGSARTAFSARRPPQRGRFRATQATRIARHPKVSFERIVVSLLGVADDMRRVAGTQWLRGLQCLVECIADQMLAGWRAAWSRTTLCSEQGYTCG